MKVYYDLHLHSCLSPCGDNDMTPNNIIGMAKILELDIIALTDHNTIKNCPAVMALGQKNGICVVAGMELCTSEEIHMVCLFRTLELAEKFNDFLEPHILDIKNRVDIYGSQSILDENDEVVGHEEKLLITATDISISGLNDLIKNEFDGVCFPAHIDRDSYSVISSLSAIPEEENFTAVELSRDGDYETLLNDHPCIKNMHIVKDSDAHYLENMSEKQNYFELKEISANALIDFLNSKV